MVSVSHNNKNSGRVGIIAGRGDLPLSLANNLKKQGQDPFLLLVKGEALPSDYTDFSHEIIAITKVGKFLKILKKEKCSRVTLAGPVARPDFKNILPDMEGLKLLAKISTSVSKGDDGLMRAISSYIEEKGFQLVGAHELNTEFLADAGPLGTILPNEDDLLDIKEGIRITQAIGALDIGQAVIIRNGYVLGVEAAEGTEKLIERCAEFAWEKPAGILVKLAKPEQDLRADMPAVGPDTILQIVSSGLRGLAIEADRCLIVRKDEVIRLANEKGVFLYGVSTESQK
ncbi:MAG: UDP-2,3-diacylglucosamine diphosphatase LpxI [Sneathiella sp.]|nr:UDP-2,3-diacylglucosamine diphosphatase LpxI [Sneathiella sp.]